MHADASVITFTEGTALWESTDDPESLNLPFAVVAHEMAHQWTVPYAPVEVALYRELQVVTPDSLKYLLHDLFEVNTFWELDDDDHARGG